MPKSICLDAFRYITSDGWRALVAIEMGLKNHEVVPIELAQKISRCKRTGSGFLRLIKDQLVPNGLVAFESDSRKRVQGYRLTNRGYDYLALHQLFSSGQLSDFKSMIGAGKESDVYLAYSGDRCGLLKAQSEEELPLIEAGLPVVVKFHRLGRTSFRKVKEKRDYHQHRSTCSWLYLDRLASQREFTMMQVLHKHGLAVPQALAHNRNAVVMSFVSDSVPLSRVLPVVLRCNGGALAYRLYKQAINMLHKIASVGLVHGDLNEFNLMVTGLCELEDETSIDEAAVNLVLIDFPQMISRNHPSAPSIYRRDAEGIVSFFGRFCDIPAEEFPMELENVNRVASADVDVKAPGYGSSSHSRRRLNGNILLGCTAVHETSGSDSSLDEEESDDNGSATAASDISASDEEPEQSTEDEVECDDDSQDEEIPVSETLTDSTQNTSIAPPRKTKKRRDLPKPATGLFGPDEIRARKQQEIRHKQQQQFQRQVKRHSRANVKRQNQASLKAELTLFG